MIQAPPDSQIEVWLQAGETDLVGTLAVRVLDSDEAEVIARTTAGISETPAGSGIYRKAITTPSAAGDYLILWDRGADPDDYAPEELRVLYNAPTTPGTPEDGITPADVRSRSPYLQRAFPDSTSDDELAAWIAEAVPLVCSLTCRAIAPVTEGEPVPEDMWPLALRAVTMKVEQLYGSLGTYRDRRSSMNRGGLRGFSAGNYSESYFGPLDAMKAYRLDPDPRVHEVLWALCTEECREAWLQLWDPDRPDPPAALAQSFEYQNRPPGDGRGGGCWGC